MRWIPALLLLLLPPLTVHAGSPVDAGQIDWPDLPTTCFVKGRPATPADVKKGCAAFVATANGKDVGKPLNIAIPQYAYQIDKETHTRTPVILIQAEEGLGIKMAGYTIVGSDKRVVDLLSSLELLGSKKPK